MRNSREEWLETALEILSREGESTIRVRNLSQALGVSTGSFYWHFRDRADFLESIFRYWGERYTQGIIQATIDLDADGRSKLLSLTDGIIRGGLNRYEVAVRAWVAHEPALVPLLKEVDETRYAFVSRLLSDVGFSGAELRMRIRAYLAAVVSDASQLAGRPLSIRQRLSDGRRLVEMLCLP